MAEINGFAEAVAEVKFDGAMVDCAQVAAGALEPVNEPPGDASQPN